MNKKICLKKYTGFSLAETLITLLIVAIVAIASVPVITKKKATPAEPSGTWMCTLNSQGQHVVWETGDKNMNDADQWKTTGKNYCEFSVPKGARNFAITAIGGGGGGAGAGVESKVWTTSFNVPYAGRYKMAAIGAGGNGAKGPPDAASGIPLGNVPGGGGAGGVGYAEYEFTDNVKELKVTTGSANSGFDGQNGVSGNSSTITATYQDNLYQNQNVTLLSAGGGNGGRGCYIITPPVLLPLVSACNNYDALPYGQQGGVSFMSSSNDYIKVIEQKSFNNNSYGYGRADKNCEDMECFGHTTVSEQIKINNKLSPYFIFVTHNVTTGEEQSDYYEYQFGRGGLSEYIINGSLPFFPKWPSYKGPLTQSGINGRVMITTTFHKPGLGGEAGEHVERAFYSEFDSKKLKVIIGKGGTGGSAGSSEPVGNVYNPYISTKKPTEATDGTSTQIVGLLTLYGGKHGKSLQEDNIKALQEAKGGDGVPSPLRKSKKLVEVGSDMDLLKKYQTGLGGLSQGNTSVDGQTSLFYGAGGGGGGVDADSKAGKGADGSPGFVIIEW